MSWQTQELFDGGLRDPLRRGPHYDTPATEAKPAIVRETVAEVWDQQFEKFVLTRLRWSDEAERYVPVPKEQP